MPELEDVFGGTPQPEAGEQAPVEQSPPMQGGTSPQSQPGNVPAPSQTQQTPAPAASSLQPSLLQRAQAAGLKLDGIDNSERLSEYLMDQLMESRPYADIGRSSLASQPVGQGSQDKVSEQEPGEDQQDGFDIDGHFNGLWNAPQIDDQAKFLISRGIVELGDDGLYAAKPGYEAIALPVLNSLNQAHVAQREQVQGLFEGNFYKNVYEKLLPAFQAQWAKDYGQHTQQAFAQYGHQNFEQSFQEKNAAWLYNAQGQLTPDGIKFRDTVAQLRQNGVQDPQTLADWALKLSGVNSNAGSGQQDVGGTEAAVPPAPSNVRAKDPVTGQFVKQAPAGMPAATPKTKQESFLESAKRNAEGGASQSGYTESAGMPVIANEGDLDNMFTNEYKRQMAAA